MTNRQLLTDLQVSATNQLLEALVGSEHRMRQRLDLLSEVVFELDAQGMIIFMSNAWETLMGVPSSQMVGHSFQPYLLAEDRPTLDLALVMADKESQARRSTVRFVKGCGQWVWTELAATRTKEGFVGSLRDITEQRQAQEHLEYIAHYDALTCIPNRILLSDRIRQAMASCKRSKRSLNA